MFQQMSSVPETAVLRSRCKLLREYPLSCMSIYSSLTELFPEGSQYHILAMNLSNYEQSVSKTATQDGMWLRELLGDTTVVDNINMTTMTPKIKSNMADKVSSLLAIYRILELEVHRIAWEPCPVPVLRVKFLDAKMAQKNSLYTKLFSWPDILAEFKNVIYTSTSTIDIQPITDTDDVQSGLRGLPSHLQWLAETHLNLKLQNLLFNFRAAALNYSLITGMASSDAITLPGIPHAAADFLARSDFRLSPQDWERYPPNTLNKINIFLQGNRCSELRLPLHLSLLLSPIFLLIPVNLPKANFLRTSVYELSIALGNQKPVLLDLLEREIWKAFLSINENSEMSSMMTAFKALIHSEAYVKAMCVPRTDPAFHFFSPCDQLPLIGRNTQSSSTGLTSVLSQRNSAEGENVLSPKGDTDEEEEDEGNEDEEDGTRNSQENIVAPKDDTDEDGDEEEDSEKQPSYNEEEEDEEEDQQDNDDDDEEEDSETKGNGDRELRSDIERKERGDGDEQQQQHDIHMNSEDDEYSGEEEGDDVEMDDGENNGGGKEDNDQDDETSMISNEAQQAPPNRAHAAKAKGGSYAAGPTKSSRRSHRKFTPRVVIEDEDDEDKCDTEKWVKLDDDLFVEAEKCNLDITEQPKLSLGRSVTAWGPRGEKVVFVPMAHVEDSLKFFGPLVKRLEQGYQDGRPLYLDPEDNQDNVTPRKESVFKIMTEKEFKALSDLDVQDILRRQHIVVTDMMHNIQTFEEAVDEVAPRTRVTTVQDQSYPLDSPDVTRSGTVGDILQASKLANPKILNGLFFPNPWANIERISFASDVHALLRMYLCDGSSKKQLDTREDTQWFLISLQHTLHRWHIDSDGFGTFIDPVTGAKWWFVARPIGDLNFDAFNMTTLLLNKNFELTTTGEGLFEIEAILLLPGSRLIMRPNTIHAVYTPEKSVCRGGHFYATSTMQDTFVGIVHTFICDLYITNIAHFPSRYILTQMINFYHAALVRGEIDPEDPAHPHTIQLDKPNSLMDLLIVCALGVLINVISFETYTAAGIDRLCKMNEDQHTLWNVADINALSDQDRKRCCLARGEAFELVAWVDANYTTGLPNSPVQLVFSHLLLNICKMLCNYKWLADKDGVHHIPGLTLDRLQHQIAAVLILASRRNPAMIPMGSADIDPKTWKLPMQDMMGQSILPQLGPEKLDFQKAPSREFKRLTIHELSMLGETSLDQKFARRVSIKQEIIDDDFPTGKKRARHC